jgi:hypothetical protein
LATRHRGERNTSTFSFWATTFDDGAALPLKECHTVASYAALLVFDHGASFKHDFAFFR